MNAYIIAIGDELLMGQVIDTNSAWMGQQLADIGVDVLEKIVIKDDINTICHTLEQAVQKADIVLISGGLGPTKDDVTKEAIAQFLNVGLEFREDMYAIILNYFNKLQKIPSEAVKNQCYLPVGTTMILNKMGTAPGMEFEFEGSKIIAMPGVPYEMKYIMEHGVLPQLKSDDTFEIYHKTIRTYGIGETRIAEKINDIEIGLRSDVKLAYLPHLGGVRIRLSGINTGATSIAKYIDDQCLAMSELIQEWIYGYDDDDLLTVVVRLLKERNELLALAESCTGGYVSQLITSLAGVSSFYRGSIVSYDNYLKEKVLQVQSETLLSHGAVSEQCVLEMLTGVLNLYQANVGISISGIAGPDGGTKDKPVGTVWIAYGSKDNILTEKLQLGKDRKLNIEYTSYAALNLLRKFLLRY